jgi:hypothetical protein
MRAIANNNRELAAERILRNLCEHSLGTRGPLHIYYCTNMYSACALHGDSASQDKHRYRRVRYIVTSRKLISDVSPNDGLGLQLSVTVLVQICSGMYQRFR